MTRVLAACGSLRAASSNAALLDAAAQLAPAGARVERFLGIGELPHFNPDLDREADTPPPAVARWRDALRECDALLLSSPEYVHGVPGALKDALDWIVSSGELCGKPLALIDTSRSHFATPQLREILATMEARIVPEASITLHLASNRVDASAILANERAASALRAAVAALVASARGAASQ
ncbi:MAG: NAD(P)H-dependent oxidoreductase [Deltaproteobacteria bacterium]|nr:NAD(P)H-dependent oxidoreductase [Deltaproteobacteria bacterium]